MATRISNLPVQTLNNMSATDVIPITDVESNVTRKVTTAVLTEYLIANGAIGYSGSVGSIGYTGSNLRGYTGSSGLGYTGSTGAGYVGSSGIIGYTGSGTGASTGDIGFTATTMYSLTGMSMDNSDLSHGATASVTLPTNGSGTLSVSNTYGDVQFVAGVSGVNKFWTLQGNGTTILPNGNLLSLRQGASSSRTTWQTISTATSTVVWSSISSNISSVKLVIQVEGYEQGNTGSHTQAAEAIVAARGLNAVGDPSIAIYGVVQTCVNPLATFTVQRNLTTNLIEIVATPTVTADFAGQTQEVIIHSIELSTWD